MEVSPESFLMSIAVIYMSQLPAGSRRSGPYHGVHVRLPGQARLPALEPVTRCRQDGGASLEWVSSPPPRSTESQMRRRSQNCEKSSSSGSESLLFLGRLKAGDSS